VVSCADGPDAVDPPGLSWSFVFPLVLSAKRYFMRKRPSSALQQSGGSLVYPKRGRAVLSGVRDLGYANERCAKRRAYYGQANSENFLIPLDVPGQTLRLTKDNDSGIFDMAYRFFGRFWQA
jgi:hypothetical protein